MRKMRASQVPTPPDDLGAEAVLRLPRDRQEALALDLEGSDRSASRSVTGLVDFGVTWNAAMDTGGAYLGERVQISLAIMAVRQD